MQATLCQKKMVRSISIGYLISKRFLSAIFLVGVFLQKTLAHGLVATGSLKVFQHEIGKGNLRYDIDWLYMGKFAVWLGTLKNQELTMAWILICFMGPQCHPPQSGFNKT